MDLTILEPKDINTPFLWRTVEGKALAPEKMETRHLFFTLRMIWNHSAPEEIKLKPYTKHKFRPFYTPSYMREAIKYLLREVMKRTDLTPAWEMDIYYMIHNARQNLITQKGEKAMKDQWSFYVAGVQHHELFRCIDELSEGEQLFLVPEPSNQYDPNAVKIVHSSTVHDEDIMVGYVPGKISAEVSAFIETADDPVCFVEEVTPSAKPWQQLKVIVKENKQDG